MRSLSSGILALGLALGGLHAGEARADDAPSAEERGAARRLLEAGKEAFRAARFDDAAKLFGEAYAKDPSLDAALFNQAYALRRAERYADARDAYRRYLERHPDDLDTHYALGRTAQLLGDDEDARKWYASYVEKEKRKERARYVEHAKAQLELLAPVKPAPAVAEQKPAEPKPAVEKAPQPPPYDAAARFAEAMQRYQQKRYRDAATLFLEVYEHDAKHTKALYRHALALRQAGDLDEARAAYERFLSVEPADPDGVYGLAETERAAGKTERAIGLYERYLEVEKRPSEEPWKARAREYIAVLRASLAPKPSPEAPAVVETPAETPAAAAPPAQTTPAETPPAEKPAVVASFSYGPSDAHSPRLVRVAALAPLDDTPPAEPPVPPVDVEALLEEGEAKLGKKDAEGALKAFQRAHAAAPSSSRPHWGLARAYELAGLTSAAKHHYRLYRELPAADRDEAKADAAWWKLETLP